jgi:hypothetical protein
MVFDIFEIEKLERECANVGGLGGSVTPLPSGLVRSNRTTPTITLLSISYLGS